MGIRSDHNPNARIEFAEGDLVSRFTQSFKMSRLATGGVRAVPSGANPQAVKLSVNASGGNFSGTFIHPVSSEVVKFKGVFKDQDGQGGFTGTSNTGRVQILGQ